MPCEFVESIDDPRVAVYRDLPRSNLTRPSGLFVAEGHLLVERLLTSGFEVDSILLDEKFVGEWESRIPPGVATYVVPSALINKLLGFKFHRGILACGRRRQSRQLETSGKLEFNSTSPLAVICVDIHDPENMGAILRNCAAFGVNLVLATSRCADPFSRRVLRTSMGTVFKLPLFHSTDIVADLRRLRVDYDFQLAATVLAEQAQPLDQFQRSARLALLFGNEGHGLPAEIVRECDRQVMIPMHLGTDSLNVSVAAGIFLYHLTK